MNLIPATLGIGGMQQTSWVGGPTPEVIINALPPRSPTRVQLMPGWIEGLKPDSEIFVGSDGITQIPAYARGFFKPGERCERQDIVIERGGQRITLTKLIG